jgi:hypothetical protein
VRVTKPEAHSADPADRDDADATHRAHIDAIVAAAPTLTRAQADKLRPLIAPLFQEPPEPAP